MKKVTHLPKAVTHMLRGIVLFLGLSFLTTGMAAAQGNVTCPPNVDFAYGDFTNWLCYTGTSNVGTSTVVMGSITPTAPVAGLWDIMSGSGLDPMGKFPQVAPGGAPYSVRLGDTSAGAKAERIRYYVHVPAGFNDYSFNYRFACVLEDPGHSLDTQPLFEVTAFDSATGAPLPCLPNPYVASPALIPLGFKNYVRYAYDTVRYLPWTGSALPLIGVGGQTIIVQVTAMDCAAGGHFGYGYFDVISCGKYKAAVSYCNLDSGIVRFIGTGITQNYNWYTSNWTLIGTGPYIDAQIPNTPDFFWGVLASGSPGCLDTIKTDTVSNFLLNTTPKTPCVQFGNPITLNTQAVGGIGPFTYTWSGYQASNLSCINCQNPVATPNDTTTFYVTAVDRIGCMRRDTVNIYQAPNAGPDLKVCPLGERPAELHVAGPPNASFHWYDYGTNNPGQYLSCTDCTDPTSAPVPSVYTYTVGYDGCPVLDTITIYHDTSNYIVAPQDLLVVCRPDYRNLLSQAYGPFPKMNIACGTNNPITCLPADQDTATVGIVGTPPKNNKNTPLLTANRFIKYQFIIKKKDLLYSGLYSGTLNSMAFRTLKTSVLSSVPLEYITVSLGCIDQKDFPTPTSNNSFYGSTALTPVAYLGSYNITADAWNSIQFDAPYSWDTSKNLLVDFCIGPITTPDVNGIDPVSMEEGVSIQKFSDAINVCGGNAPVVYKYGQRPTVQFNYCPTPDLPFQYTWRPGNNLNDSNVQNPQAYIPRSVDYAVYSVGRNGCSLRDSLHIFVPDHHLNAGPVDTFICQGQPAFLFASGGQSYKWFEVQEGLFTDASGSLNCTDCQFPTATPMTTTTYAVVFANEVGVGNSANPEYTTGCPDTMMITVHVWPLPNVQIMNADTTITIGQSIQLHAQGAQHYSWSPSGSLSDPNAPVTTATPTTTTTYIATGFDTHGCPDTDTMKVTINYHTNLLVPTGFTPNGDGINDIFKIVNANVQRLMEFRVFNRWGQEIFSTTDINKGWDGTWKGVPQELGTYQYIIRVGYGDQTVEMYKGDVSLIR